MATFASLPSDILYCIFPYLDPATFLALTCSNKTLLSYRQDPNYWRLLTRSTFRIPEQPLLQADGARWQWLYKNLLTKTQLFTWGSNGSGNLGHASDRLSPTLRRRSPRGPPFVMRRERGNNSIIGWPRRVPLEAASEKIGIVADVQCGGWSTVLLNSDGILWMFGNIGEVNYGFRPFEPYARKLGFPPAYPATSKERYEPSTAVAQFSTGRACVLGLSDDGKVWHWQKQVAFLVKPLHVNVEENRVTRVVAGWEEASMYVNGVGIVYWRHIIAPERLDSDADSLLMDTTTIPGTGFRRLQGRQNDKIDTSIGEVVNHIVLERYIIFTTDNDQIFCFDTSTSSTAVPVELTSFYLQNNEMPFQIRDIQGTFQSFAVFTTSGSILTGTVTNLEPTRPPTIIRSLQESSIISLAYGDHHFLALRANGIVSAYGRELNSCGAFGLGNHWNTAPLRGVGVTDFAGNGIVLGDRGREVWFEPLMKVWLEDMREKGRNTAMGNVIQERGNRESFETIKAVGDFIEGEGRKWEEGVTAEGDMGAYFVLKVAAAGWHSAALVLVDEEKAEQARKNHVIMPEERSVAPRETLDRDAPWGVFNWAWELGRWFLGLTDRDARTAEGQQSSAETDGENVRYTWTDQPFPSLNSAGGQLM